MSTSTAPKKPKPSSLAQQIKAAQKEWAKMSPEKRASIKLEGSSDYPAKKSR